MSVKIQSKDAKSHGLDRKPLPSVSGGKRGAGKNDKDAKNVNEKKLIESDLDQKKREAREILQSTYFDAAIGLVILLNAITIGIEQTLTINGQSTLFVRIVESIFLMIYILELSARFFGYGRHCLRDKWVKLDAFLVFLGVLNSWILEPAFDEAPDEMGPLMLLRTARLMRLAKTARLLSKVPEMWMLVRGLMNSSMLMLYTMSVMVVLLYCFTVLGVELITKNSLATTDDEFRETVEKHFGSVPGTMLTMVQFLTMDDLAAVYRPLCEKDPWLAFYFTALVLLISVLLVNLVTAVIVSSTLDANQQELDSAQETQERDWGSLISNLKDMFNRLDEDKSGQLTLDEFEEVDRNDQKLLCQALEVSTPAEIFRMLDTEKTGQVSINEFFDCILDKVLAVGDANLKRMERQIETMHWRLKETFSAQNDIGVQMKEILIGIRELTGVVELKRKGNGNGHHSFSPQVSGMSGLDGMDASKFSVPPHPPTVDAEMESWEQEMSHKLQDIIDDGLQIAFERLRKVAGSAKAETRVRKNSTESTPARRTTCRTPSPPNAKGSTRTTQHSSGSENNQSSSGNSRTSPQPMVIPDSMELPKAPGTLPAKSTKASLS